MLSKIVDLIILVGAVCGAIYKTWDFFAQPTSALKKKAEEKEAKRIKAILEKELPKYLEQHDLNLRDRYKADRQQYLIDIKDEVVETLGTSVMQNATDLESLKISARDVLREKIMGVYHKDKYDRALTQYEKEALDQYYKDYKALNGNSYIDKYYNRMKSWTIVYDDYTEDDE